LLDILYKHCADNIRDRSRFVLVLSTARNKDAIALLEDARNVCKLDLEPSGKYVVVGQERN